jgi:hypothetical protein
MLSENEVKKDAPLHIHTVYNELYLSKEVKNRYCTDTDTSLYHFHINTVKSLNIYFIYIFDLLQ